MTTPWSSETSWTVSRGSLDSIVTFESFDFPIDPESTSRKPPLLLVPPSSPDFEPCEIKLNFTQKHEIRQVYVRSTARVYEIYYAPSLQSDNEYLCTVRCSAASVEDNSFSATEVKEAVSVKLDDWVEVKLPVGPDQTSNNSQNYQDFYEATAEINDSEPCMSLILRLLSLKSKGCVYVDEVYVFADPIDSNDSENDQTVSAETSAGSSLMTMLVPTLLGLTKSRSAQLHDQSSSNPVGKPIKTELESTTLAKPVNLVHQQHETLSKPSEAKAELTQTQLPVSYTRTEILLEQLVSRVSRIEDICLRFEESMLKPMNNMEARLQRVEKQVELLGRRPVSPSFSRLEPDPSSISNDGHDSQLGSEPELEKTVSFSNGKHETPEDTSVVTVQEIPCDEKVEVDDVLESPKKETPKKTVSIDDALAAALAGFSSFTKPNDSFTVESHEEECLERNEASIDTTPGEEEASVSSKSLKATALEFIEEENDETTTRCDVSTEIPDNSFDSHGISELDDEEDMGPTTNFSSPSSPHETDAQQESIKTVKVLTFDKTDILKYFPDQPPDAASESRVDFESPILEVKFASSENGSLKCPLEALWTDSDDAARPATDEGVLIEERNDTANNLLVDLDGDDVGEEVQQDLPPAQLKTSFASLI